MSLRSRGLPAVVRSLAVGMLLLSFRPAAGAAVAPVLSDAQLLQQVRAGGYVLVLRHAQAPDTSPSAPEAEPDNPRRERQLSDNGKQSARELGAALHGLHVPIGPIYSSPTFRALQTIRLAQLGPARTVSQLAEGSRGMSGAAAQAQISWLRRAIERPPPAGSNTLIVTHTPNIVGAFGPEVADIAAGEMLVFEPGRRALVGRLTIDAWRRLAQLH